MLLKKDNSRRVKERLKTRKKWFYAPVSLPNGELVEIQFNPLSKKDPVIQVQGNFLSNNPYSNQLVDLKISVSERDIEKVSPSQVIEIQKIPFFSRKTKLDQKKTRLNFFLEDSQGGKIQIFTYLLHRKNLQRLKKEKISANLKSIFKRNVQESVSEFITKVALDEGRFLISQFKAILGGKYLVTERFRLR